MVDQTQKINVNMMSIIIYCFAALLMPGITLFNLYNQNYAANHIVFNNVLLLAGAAAIAGILLFLIFIFAAGSKEGALLLAVLFWVYFWAFRSLLNVLSRYFTTLTSLGLAVFLGIFLIITALLLRQYKPLFIKARPAFGVLAVTVMVLFVFNLIPGVRHEFVLQRGRAERAERAERADSGRAFYIKRDFIVDPRLPKPDIHWFHTDGMISLEKIEQFWGECQEYLREELGKRGFLIYENAALNGGYTIAVMPALLSPAFYDSYYGERLNELEKALRSDTEGALHTLLARDGLTFRDDIMPYYELFTAVSSAGYEIVQGEGRGNNLWWVFENVIPFPMHGSRDGHAYIINWWDRFLSGDLPELLSLTTPFNIPPGIERVPIEIRHSDDGSDPLPSFSWHTFLYTHVESWRISNPALSERELRGIHGRTDLYPTAYRHQAREVLAHIDLVLEENPDAVIVLQADHGFHYQATQQSLLDQGYSQDEVLDLVYSVFSAVRIPARYGGLDAPIAPLNISRELVNRFVGENYDLLQN
jgi:hypothetical protein